mgnify:CR=1 FL=1
MKGPSSGCKKFPNRDTKHKNKMSKNTQDRQVVVQGKVMWQSLDKPNELSGKHQIDLCQLDKDAVKALEATGLEVRDGGAKKPDHGKYITPKANRQVVMVDANKDAWDMEKLLGNGTLVNCAVRAYDYDYKGKKGVAAGLQAIQVLEHISYDPAASFQKEEAYITAPSEDDVPF